MSKLEELIIKLCPNGIKYYNLEDCCYILDSKRMPIAKSQRVEGKYPYYGANGIQDYVSDYLFEGEFVLVGEDGSVINSDGTPVVTWATGKIWVNNHAHIIQNKDGVLLRFIFHYLQTINISSLIQGSIPKLNQKNFREIKIPLPPLEIQHEIIKILDNFVELTAELTAELSARKKQFEYYRNQLISVQNNNMHSNKLSEIALIYDGTHQTPKYQETGIPFISVENIVNIYDTDKYISLEEYNLYKVKPQLNDLFMTRIGTVGKCAIVNKLMDLAYYVSLALIRPDSNIIDTRYLKYYIESSLGKKELSKRVLHHAVPVKINKEDIGKIMISYPELSIQKKIADLLDNFESICADLDIGLPAEIEARKKQYEFYRDHLLTFIQTGHSILTDRQTDRQTDSN